MRIPNLRLSRRGYVALTVAGILLPTIFLSLLGVYLVDKHFRFQRVILEEYSRFSVEYAATEIQRAITGEERDIASYLQLVALVDGYEPQEELRRAEITYPLLADPFVRRLDGSLVFARPEPAPPPGGSALAAEKVAQRAQRRVAAEGIVRRVVSDETVKHVLLSGDVHYYTGSVDSVPYQLVVFPYRDSRNTDLGVSGFFLDADYLRQVLVGRVLDTTIHSAEGRFAPDFGKVLTMVVRDDRNEVVYSHRHVEPGETHRAGYDPNHVCKTPRYLAQSELAEVLPGWRVGITYRKSSGFAWTRRIVGLQFGLLLLAAVLVVLGTLLTMRFSLRQMELSRLKSHFVSNITHELKTPLAAIRLYTETLQQGRVRDRGEADRFLGIIHKETVRLTALINNILDFSRIEDGRRRYTFAVESVGNVVRDVVDSYAYQLRDKGFELHLEVEPDLPPARVDRDAVGQAVLNLLDNAVKYSEDDKEVWVAVRYRNGNGAHASQTQANGSGTNGTNGSHDANGSNGSHGKGAIEIEVRDRGIGIPAVEQLKIFDAFYRVEKGLEHDVKGSGLGLAVVKHIAEAHGGRVEVHSESAAGSTFTLHLPVAVVETEASWETPKT
jgi:signal transduction histidine kinase